MAACLTDDLIEVDSAEDGEEEKRAEVETGEDQRGGKRSGEQISGASSKFTRVFLPGTAVSSVVHGDTVVAKTNQQACLCRCTKQWNP